MATIKIAPQNLTNIQRHFEKQKSEVQRKLIQVNKRKRDLETELETLKDGVEWCQNLYKTGVK